MGSDTSPITLPGGRQLFSPIRRGKAQPCRQRYWIVLLFCLLQERLLVVIVFAFRALICTTYLVVGVWVLGTGDRGYRNRRHGYVEPPVENVLVACSESPHT